MKRLAAGDLALAPGAIAAAATDRKDLPTIKIKVATDKPNMIFFNTQSPC
jgi:hypothetical protein